MTTGMRPDRTTTEAQRERRVNWTWGIIALIVAAILVGVAVYSEKHTGANSPAAPATTGSVQNSATGQQGAVGNFAEQVQPNNQQSKQNNNQGATPQQPSATYNNAPSNAPAEQAGPNGYSSSKGTANESQSAGAGNTGITTATDAMGGASTKGMQGAGTPGGAGNSSSSRGGVQ